MKSVSELKEGSKIRGVYNALKEFGFITNIQALGGDRGFRTNRLSSMIHILKEEYGIKIETNVIKSQNGNYLDCKYTLIEEDKDASPTA